MEGTLRGNLSYLDNGTVEVADSQEVLGAVTSSGNAGILTLMGNSTVSGQVGGLGKLLVAVNGGVNGRPRH